MEEIKKEEEKKPIDSQVHENEKKEEEVIDYKAELEKTKLRLKQAEYKIEKERKEKEDFIPAEIDIDSIAKKVSENVKAELSKDAFEEILETMSSDADERELIKLNYETGIIKSGTSREAIKNDLLNARLLANRPKYEKTFSEIKKSIISDKTKNNSGSASGQQIDKVDTLNLSPEEEKWVKQTSLRLGKKIEDVKAMLLKNRFNK